MRPRCHRYTALLAVVMAAGVLGVIGLAGEVRAQPVDPPFSITIEGDFTSRDIDGLADLSLQSHVGRADSNRVLVTLSYAPIPPVRLYAVVGGADLIIDDVGYSAGMNGIYGGGLTLTIYHSPMMPGLEVFLDGRYLRSVTNDTVFIGGPTSTREEITWNEYRTRIGAKAHYWGVEPYGGIQVSFVRATDHLDQWPTTGSPISFGLRENDQVGLFGGLTVALDPRGRAALFAEFNIIDENAVRAGLRFSM